tara:strand:- start:306 stop:776 length:471 start_codon:yes stop_codon:yes gene_type:complete
MDLKNILNNEDASEPVDCEPVEYEQVDCESVECENESASEIESDTKNDRFKKTWNKLEKGMKLNRLLVFIDHETNVNELSTDRIQDLKNLLFRAIDIGDLNKSNDIIYNIESCEIESIKILEYNSTSKKYKLKTKTSKNRSVSKSRSNLDRLIKKK